MKRNAADPIVKEHRPWWVLGLVGAWMLATRTDHFGSALHLPDASLAAFFVAGYALGRGRPGVVGFLGLCGLAFAIDAWAILGRGVSAFCITPAYGFLLPTYWLLWWAGARAPRPYLARPFASLGIAALATAGAFFVSSGSFYLLAPYFPERSVAEFAARTARYFPPYLTATLGWLAWGALLHASFALRAARRLPHHAR
ncbi:MAG: hypothetical protein KatS3mg124_2509 [Porticoccaceae bacterium]|nr:MAG: hypothetical protein KatS3mg124_2509 [Porticoccaceae bacterium]